MIDNEIKYLENKIKNYRTVIGCIVLLNTKDREKFIDMQERLDYLKAIRNIVNNLEQRGRKVNV